MWRQNTEHTEMVHLLDEMLALLPDANPSEKTGVTLDLGRLRIRSEIQVRMKK